MHECLQGVLEKNIQGVGNIDHSNSTAEFTIAHLKSDYESN